MKARYHVVPALMALLFGAGLCFLLGKIMALVMVGVVTVGLIAHWCVRRAPLRWREWLRKKAAPFVLEAQTQAAEQLEAERARASGEIVEAQRQAAAAKQAALAVLDTERKRAADALRQVGEARQAAALLLEQERQKAGEAVKQVEQASRDWCVAAFLGPLDCLNYALKACSAPDQPECIRAHADGLRRVQRLFFDSLTQLGVCQHEPIGERFDPHRHHAVALVTRPELEPNTIADVVNHGYFIPEGAKNRVLRAAQVTVVGTGTLGAAPLKPTRAVDCEEAAAHRPPTTGGQP